MRKILLSLAVLVVLVPPMAGIYGYFSATPLYLLASKQEAVVASAVPVLAGHYNTALKIGVKAPDFSGIPAASPSGEQTSITLSDLKEDVIVLAFLANHCPAVQAADYRIISFISDYKDKPVKLVAVSVSDIEQDKKYRLCL